MELRTQLLITATFALAIASTAPAGGGPGGPPPSGSWVAAADATQNGTCTYNGPSLTCTHTSPPHFGGIATSNYNRTVAYEYGFPWLCDDTSSFSRRAEALDTLWTKRWNWVTNNGTPAPANESAMDITVTMTWEIDGDSNNFSLWSGYAKTWAHSQVIINAAPDNAGDYTGEGLWSGERWEGDTWSGGLSLDWDKDGPSGGVSLSWSSSPTDLWKSGPTTRTKRYLQNVKNMPGSSSYDYIYVSVALLSEVEAAADGNAMHAIARAECEITGFLLGRPQ